MRAMEGADSAEQLHSRNCGRVQPVSFKNLSLTLTMLVTIGADISTIN